MTGHQAAIAPHKTRRQLADAAAWDSQAFELNAAADYRQPSLRETGWRARGALAIDVPRTLAASPRGWWLATTVVEQGPGRERVLRPAPTGTAVR